jgi:hypothetical protein
MHVLTAVLSKDIENIYCACIRTYLERSFVFFFFFFDGSAIKKRAEDKLAVYSFAVIHVGCKKALLVAFCYNLLFGVL